MQFIYLISLLAPYELSFSLVSKYQLRCLVEFPQKKTVFAPSRSTLCNTFTYLYTCMYPGSITDGDWLLPCAASVWFRLFCQQSDLLKVTCHGLYVLLPSAASVDLDFSANGMGCLKSRVMVDMFVTYTHVHRRTLFLLCYIIM